MTFYETETDEFQISIAVHIFVLSLSPAVSFTFVQSQNKSIFFLLLLSLNNGFRDKHWVMIPLALFAYVWCVNCVLIVIFANGKVKPCDSKF